MNKKEKLLITGGCSNSSNIQFGGGLVKDYVKDNIFTWPTLVAEKLNMNLLNVAMGGASNDYIENVIYDAIIENHDKYDCTVMVFWTSGQRINFFDHQTIMDYSDHLSSNARELWNNVDGKKVINKSFRNMKRTKFLCEYYKIPLVQRISLGFLFESQWDCLKTWVQRHPDIKELNLSWQEVYFGRWSSNRYWQEVYFGKWSRSQMISKFIVGSHPNQDGHKLIAQMFIDSLNEKELEVFYDGRPHDGGGYVYD